MIFLDWKQLTILLMILLIFRCLEKVFQFRWSSGLSEQRASE